MSVKVKNVAIIGAGNSGLAAAKVFSAQGHKVSVFERSHDLGGVWERSRSYPDVQTQSPKEIYSYSDFPMPEDYPQWPKGEQIQEYFRSYAEKFELLPLIHFDSTVTAMQHLGAGQGWQLEIEKNGESRSETFDFVVSASGIFSNPNRLNYEGEVAFKEKGGTVLHSCEYTDSSIVKDKKVVVLGFSKSATDIAVNAVHSGAAEVTIVYREPVWRIPYFFGNVLNFKNILYSRASEKLFKPWGLRSLGKLMYKIATPLIWANWRALEALLTAQFKLNKHKMRPKGPIEAQISCGLSIATPDFYTMLDDGRMHAVQSTIDHYDSSNDTNNVVLNNGERLEADVIIMAVGWQQGLPYLPEDYRDTLMNGDGQYRLYRNIVNPDIPDMGFVGFNSSFASTLTGEISANWLLRYMDKQLVNLPEASEMQENIAMMLQWRREEQPIMSGYGGLCVAPYHFRHLDELMRDMGGKTHRSNPLAAQFAPLDPSAYAGFLASAPDYQVG